MASLAASSKLPCVRNWFKRWHRSRIRQLAVSDSTALKTSAIVFSPHQDDEVLGCGGTILRKKQAGAEIKIVFLCDGSESQSHLIPPRAMAEMRQKEAFAAAEKLGIEAQNVLFLGFKDGQLAAHRPMAVARVAALLREHQPEEVYIPYCLDPHLDHSSTHAVVMQALQAAQRRAMVFEYPVWFWHHWPWVEAPRGRLGRGVLREILKSNLKLRQDFNHAVLIKDVLGAKRQALDQHASQLTRASADPACLSLAEVANGDFLDCFFQDHEVFYRHSSH